MIQVAGRRAVVTIIILDLFGFVHHSLHVRVRPEQLGVARGSSPLPAYTPRIAHTTCPAHPVERRGGADRLLCSRPTRVSTGEARRAGGAIESASALSAPTWTMARPRFACRCTLLVLLLLPWLVISSTGEDIDRENAFVGYSEGRQQGECADASPFCSDWAANGECEVNSGYMHESCRKSCGRCGAQAGEGEIGCVGCDVVRLVTAYGDIPIKVPVMPPPPGCGSPQIVSSSCQLVVIIASSDAEWSCYCNGMFFGIY